MQPDPFEKYGRVFAAGQCIFAEGELGAIMYIIRSGKVRITKRSRDVEKTLAVLETGDVFGEMAVIDKGVRSATATAVTETACIALDEDLFEAQMREDTRVVKRVLKNMSDRLREADEQIANLLIRDPHSRVAHALLRLARRHGGGARTTEIRLAGTNADELSRGIGLEENVVKEQLGQMLQAKLVSLDSGALTLSSLESLEAYIQRLERKGQAGS